MTDLVALDDFDYRILERARRNNLEPARVTAEAVGLSESAVLRRLRRLRADGVIVRDIAIVDPARIAPHILIHVLVTMRSQEKAITDAFKRAMTAAKAVLGCWDVTGETDFLLTVAVPTMAAYEDFSQSELSSERGVRNFRTMIVIREVVGFDPSRVELT
ncbi:Lrp/AsnC family transcriptional regulator [Asticcacaulis biprosthecium]|nr:Lrp/AsnC family transcriptional regulator [Asticcacaulis biprosthecium]